MKTPDTNAAGEHALWDKGNLIGYGKMEMYLGRLVLASKKPFIKAMVDAAQADGIALILNQGYRSFSQQRAFRKKNVKDKTKANNEEWLLNAPPSEFSPATAKPGWSNHHDGSAYDIDTTDDKGKIRPAYGWLVKNAITYGFIRTVASETWHWEHRPGAGQYSVVPENHPSWKTS
jgi:LAS superfamily LD-carboxypeptidase LdcB